MNGRLAGAGLEGNQTPQESAGEPKRGENQSGNIMFSGGVIRAHPEPGSWSQKYCVL